MQLRLRAEQAPRSVPCISGRATFNSCVTARGICTLSAYPSMSYRNVTTPILARCTARACIGWWAAASKGSAPLAMLLLGVFVTDVLEASAGPVAMR